MSPTVGDEMVLDVTPEAAGPIVGELAGVDGEGIFSVRGVL